MVCRWCARAMHVMCTGVHVECTVCARGVHEVCTGRARVWTDRWARGKLGVGTGVRFVLTLRKIVFFWVLGIGGKSWENGVIRTFDRGSSVMFLVCDLRSSWRAVYLHVAVCETSHRVDQKRSTRWLDATHGYVPFSKPGGALYSLTQVYHQCDW